MTPWWRGRPTMDLIGGDETPDDGILQPLTGKRHEEHHRLAEVNISLARPDTSQNYLPATVEEIE